MELYELDPNLKSFPSRAAYLKIENGTERTVDGYWIDGYSRLIRLFTLQPNKTTPMNTHELHPWILIDRGTGQLLNVNHQKVLYAKSTGKRERVCVHLPNWSLQDMTMMCLLKHLRDVDVVEELEIPQILKPDLRKVFLVYEEHKRRLREGPRR